MKMEVSYEKHTTHRPFAGVLNGADGVHRLYRLCTGHTVCRVGQISYLVISTLFALAVLFQVFLAGGVLFASLSWDSSPWLAIHRVFGYALSLFPVVLLVLALLGRQSWCRVGLNGLMLVLVGLQGVLIT